MAQFIPTPPANYTPETRSGGCMCGNHRYEFTGAPVESLRVLSCNCEMCTDRGSLNLYVLSFVCPTCNWTRRLRYMKPSALKWTKGSWETTSSYNWLSPYYEDYIHTKFCGNCGTFIGGAGEDYTMINSRTFDNINISKLILQPFNARGRTAKMDAEEAAKKAAVDE